MPESFSTEAFTDIFLLMILDMVRSEKISVKASVEKLSGKPPPGGKNFGLDPSIRFYAIKYGDETEEGE